MDKHLIEGRDGSVDLHAAVVVDFATNVALALSGDLAILAEQAGATALRGAIARFKSMPVFLPATIGGGGGFVRLPKAATAAGAAGEAAATKAAQAEGAAAGAARGRTLSDPLPAHPKKSSQANPHAPEPDAVGPHTVVGTRTDPKRSPEPYRQGITYDADGNPVGRTDVTNHGRSDHTNPHWHPYDPNIPNKFDPGKPGNFDPAQPMP